MVRECANIAATEAGEKDRKASDGSSPGFGHGSEGSAGEGRR